MYTVFKTDEGSTIQTNKKSFKSKHDAIEYAAILCGTTPTTVSRRMRNWSHPNDCYQVAGNETNAGVWIEY